MEQLAVWRVVTMHAAPCGGHGRLPVKLTVSFIARKRTDLNN